MNLRLVLRVVPLVVLAFLTMDTCQRGPTPAPSANLPAALVRPDDPVDTFLDSVSRSLDRLSGASPAEVGDLLESLSQLIKAGPVPTGEGDMPVFTRSQRLKMDALVERMVDLQGALAGNLAATARPESRKSGNRTLDALMEGNNGKARYDQILERFARELDAWEAALAAGMTKDAAAIGVLLEADARAVIPVGTNGSVAQRNQALILSGRYADLAARAARQTK